MIDRVLIDSLNLKSRDFAVMWKDHIRKAEQLKHYQTLDDEALIEKGRPCFPLLSRTLDRGLDRSLVGGFFVSFGKEHLHGGFPISEVIYALSLSQNVVIEFLMTELRRTTRCGCTSLWARSQELRNSSFWAVSM